MELVGFQYPEISGLVVFTIVPISFFIFNDGFWEERRRRKSPYNSWLDEMDEIDEAVEMVRFNQYENNNEDWSPPLEITRLIEFIFIGGKVMAIIVFIWIIVSLGINASLKNFPKNSQLISNCTEIPQTSWHTISQCHQLKDNLYECYLGSKDIWIIDLTIRSLSIMYLFLHPPFENEQMREGSDSELSYFVPVFVMLISLICFPIIQVKGLNTIGLEICELNDAMISSKIGYLSEWWQQELVPLKQISLT